MSRRHRTRGAQGQAALELLAAIPAVVIATLVAWQLAAVIVAGLDATERARASALDRHDERGTVIVRERGAVARVLPGIGRLYIEARAVVRMP